MASIVSRLLKQKNRYKEDSESYKKSLEMNNICFNELKHRYNGNRLMLATSLIINFVLLYFLIRKG
jgi:hypothetical protein